MFLAENENVAYSFEKQVKEFKISLFLVVYYNLKDLLIRTKWRLELRTTMTVLTEMVAFQSGAAGRTLQLHTGETLLF